MIKLRNWIGALMPAGMSMPSIRDEQGQTLTEYALILVFIAVVCVVVVTTLGGTISSIFSQVTSSL